MALFQEAEYLERIGSTKKRMTDAGIDVLIVSDPANMNYLTGYDGWSFYVHQGVIVSLDAEYPLWFGREQDSNGARLTSWLPDDCIHGYPDEYVQSRYTHTMRWVADLLREKNLEKKRCRAIGTQRCQISLSCTAVPHGIPGRSAGGSAENS
jgi:Xaa-Pro dipeptidase